MKNLMQSFVRGLSQQELDTLEEYISLEYDKSSKVRSFVNRLDTNDLYNYYIPLTIDIDGFKNKFKYPEKVFDRFGRILISAPAGAGKSTFLKYVYTRCIDEGSYLPIFVIARNIDVDHETFKTHIENRLIKVTNFFEKIIDYSKILILVDGFEELPTNSRLKVAKSIVDFIDDKGDLNIVITTRPFLGSSIFREFYSATILPFNEDEISTFSDIYITDRTVRNRIKNFISSERHDFELLSNPLLLSMFLLTFNNHPEIPSQKRIFYKNIFETLYFTHDSMTKLGYSREKVSGLTIEEFEYILGMLAINMLVERTDDLSYETLVTMTARIADYNVIHDFNPDDLIADLVTQISIFSKIADRYSFVHRSLLIYFAASFLNNLEPRSKKRLYKKISEVNLSDGNTDKLIQFWDLAVEIDRAGFMRSFALPEMKKILEGVTNFTKVERLKDMTKIIDFKSVDKIWKNRYTIDLSVRTLLLYYLGIINSEVQIDFAENDEGTGSLNKMIRRNDDALENFEEVYSWYEDVFQKVKVKYDSIDKSLNKLDNDIMNMIN